MTLQVEVLGPLRVLVDGRPVELGPARRRALLAALVVDAGSVVSVEALADRVWDGEPPDGATSTVQAYMSRLRASLRVAPPAQPTGAHPADPDGPLLTRAPGYLLDVPPDAVDAHRFAALTARAQQSSSAGEHAAAGDDLRAALALWRGTPYLDVDAEFAREEERRLLRVRTAARELWARTEVALGRSAGLVEELRALVHEDPLREGLHASLVLALYREGRQAEALQQYEEVRALLGDELGIDPGAELRRLHQQVLRQDPVLDGPPPAGPASTAGPAAGRAAPVGSAPAPAGSTAGDRFQGRRVELERTCAALDRAAAGTPAVVAVVGEAGIGKTRLVEEAVAVGSPPGALVARGHCWEHEGAPVLWPWSQVLGQVADALPPAALQHVLAGRASSVAPLLPAHLTGGQPGRGTGGAPFADPPQAPPVLPGTLEGTRLRLYDAVAAFLEAASATRPLVLVLEDAHWADPATRELVEYLATTLRTGRTAVLLTVRTATGEVTRGGVELLGALLRTGRAERVELRGLSPQEVRDCVADRTGSTLDDATALALAERTDGNPFFVGELVRLLVTDVDSGADPALPDTVPDTVREVVLRRVRQMPGTDQDVLTAAAVVGRTFDPDLLEATCSLDADDVDAALDRATAAGVIRSDPDLPGHHRFVHALAQQAVLETTGPARVRRLHARIAEALRARGAPVTAAAVERLSFHLVGAGGAEQLTEAVALHLGAAEASWAGGLLPEVERLLLRALELVSRSEGPQAEQQEMAVRLRLWSLYTMADGPGTPGAVGHHARALQLVRRYGGSAEVARAHQAALADAVWHGDLVRVEALAQEMAAAAEAADDELMRLAAQLALGQHRVYGGRPAEAAALFGRAADHVTSLAEVPVGVFPLDPVPYVFVWLALARALLDQDAACRSALARVDTTTPGASLTTTAYAPTLVGLVHALRDDPAAALGPAQRAADVAREHGFTEAQLFVDVIVAWARERCSPGTSLDDARRAIAASLERPAMAMRPLLRSLVADVLLRAGEADEALVQLDAALAGAAATGDVAHAAECHRLRALCWQALGEPAERVRDEAEAAARLATAQGAHLLARRAERLVRRLGT